MLPGGHVFRMSCRKLERVPLLSFQREQQLNNVQLYRESENTSPAKI